MRYRFGGLIFGGDYTWKGLISEFPANILDLIDSNVDLLNGLGLVHEKFDAGELGPTSFRALDSCHSLWLSFQFIFSLHVSLPENC